jgi:site-specific recombinase XerD
MFLIGRFGIVRDPSAILGVMGTYLESFFTDNTAIGTFRALTNPPLGWAIERYAEYLSEERFATQSAREQLRMLGRFNQWLHIQGCTPQAAEPETFERFRDHLRKQGQLRNGYERVLRHLLKIVRPDLPADTPNPLQGLLQGYRDYQLSERGLVRTTVIDFSRLVQNFLEKQVPGGSSGDLSQVRPDLIADWIKQQANRTSAAHAKHIVTALRSFFSYAFYRGLIDRNFAPCVPGAPSWSLADLPRHLSSDQVQKVIDTCDTERRAGKRDFAILLLLARLGLRAGEITPLRLDDIDWDSGVITVRGKTRRAGQLPLPQEVGEAIADYLSTERPKCKSRQIFITARAPYRPLHGVSAISILATRALAKANVSGTRKGSHVFRHSLATTMLKNGASLREIGDVLRHRRADTTRIYAKVDLSALRELAVPFPGGSR